MGGGGFEFYFYSELSYLFRIKGAGKEGRIWGGVGKGGILGVGAREVLGVWAREGEVLGGWGQGQGRYWGGRRNG